MSLPEILSNNRRFIVTGLLVVFSLGFLRLFPESDRLSPIFQSFIVSIVFFLVIPVFYSKIVLKESLKNLGFQRGNLVAGVLAGIGSVIAAGAAVVWLASAFPDFRAQYILPASVETSFFWFTLYELVLVAFVALIYEVFFRGLTMLLWLRAFGMWAVLIQTAIFFGFAYLNYDVFWPIAPLLIFAPFAGFIAYRAQSVWYSFAASWIFLFLTDIFFLVFH